MANHHHNHSHPPPLPTTPFRSPTASVATSHAPTTSPRSLLSSSATPHSSTHIFPFPTSTMLAMVLSSPDSTDVPLPSTPQPHQHDNPPSHTSFDSDETGQPPPSVHVASVETVALSWTQSQRDFSPELFDSPNYLDTTVDLYPHRPSSPLSNPHYLLYVPKSGDTTPQLPPPPITIASLFLFMLTFAPPFFQSHHIYKRFTLSVTGC